MVAMLRSRRSPEPTRKEKRLETRKLSKKSEALAAHAETVIKRDLNLDQLPFVGRDAELAVLEGLISDLCYGRDAPRVVSVSGSSGIGKTSLVHALRSTGITGVAFMLFGRYEQLKMNNENYAGLDTAMKDLTKLVLERDFDMSMRRRLEEALTPDEANVLVRMFPTLGQILTSDYQEGELSNVLPNDDERRRIFRSFFRAMLTQKKYRDEDLEDGGESDEEEENLAIVLVVDDVQWIDAPSLDLISTLVTDKLMTSFMLVSIGRPLDEKHPFKKAISRWNSQGTRIDPLLVGRLGLSDINTIVSVILDEGKDVTYNLAEILQTRNDGNPSRAIESLKELIAKKIVRYSYSALHWSWNAENVESTIIKSEASKSSIYVAVDLKDYPLESKIVLLVASLLGATFPGTLVQTILNSIDLSDVFGEDHSVENVQALLDNLVRLRILCIRPLGYSFVDDGTKKAAADTLLENGPRLKLSIGQCLLENHATVRGKVVPSLFYHGVDLCLGESFLLANRQKVELAKELLRASEFALEESNFSLSANYAEAGVSLLAGNESSGEEKELCSELLVLEAEASLSSGRFCAVFKNLEKLRTRTCSDDLQIRVLFLKIQAETARRRTQDAIAAGIEALKLLGICRLPRNPSPMTVLREAMKTKRALRAHTPESLQTLPVTAEKKYELAYQCVLHMQTAAYLSNHNLFLAMHHICVRWSLKYGVSKHSPSIFATYGIVQQSNSLGTEVSFGELALTLSDSIGEKATKANLAMNAFYRIYPLTHRMESCYTPIVYSHMLASEVGDTETALHSLFMMNIITWCSAKMSLKAFSNELRKHCTLCLQSSHFQVLAWIVCIAKAMRKLQNADGFSWLDEMKDSIPITPQSEQFKSFNRVMTLVVHATLGNTEQAVKLANVTKQVGFESLQNQPFVPRVHFLRAVAYLSLNKRESIKEVTSVVRMLQKWVDDGNPDCVHMLRLLEAEIARLKNQREIAVELYAKTIQLASQSKHIHDAGMCHERVASFHMEDDNRYWAAQHIKHAITCYDAWGASTKVEYLTEKCAELVDETNFFAFSSHSQSHVSQESDF